MVESSLIDDGYRFLCAAWAQLPQSERDTLLGRFRVACSYNSGNMENPEITFHDTAEVFDRGGVSNFTGDVRTIFEIENLKRSWEWLDRVVAGPQMLSEPLLLDAHRMLTAGTYDEERWRKGERPGSYKQADYRVANDVGLPPEEVAGAMRALLAEAREAMEAPKARVNALTIAAYLHAVLVDVHPFADGNGRTARLLMNYVLLALGQPPCSIATEDRMAYFGALDAFHEAAELGPFLQFLKVQSLKSWPELAGALG